MGKEKKKVQHLPKIAQIPKKKTFKKGKSPFSQENSLIKWNEEFYETEHQEEYEESSVESNSDESDLIEWSGEASEATIELLYERLNDNMQKLPKSNRPNIYLKKSRTTLYLIKKKEKKMQRRMVQRCLTSFIQKKMIMIQM